jgi:hypothetical protein
VSAALKTGSKPVLDRLRPAGQDTVGNGAVAAARRAQPKAETAQDPKEGPKAPPEATEAPAAADTKAAKRSPGTDPKFGSLKKDVQRKKRTIATSHPPPRAEASSAQGAAKAPKDDEEAQGKAANAEKMNEAKPKEFDKAAFIKAVEDAIAAKAPKNLDEADKFADSGKPEEVKAEVQGQVGEGKGESAEQIATTTAAPPDTSAAVTKKVVPMAPDRPPGTPATPNPAHAVPDKLPPSATDMSAGPAKVDQQMSDAQVTETQLKKSNEPSFGNALQEKKTAEQHSEVAPGELRKSETGQLRESTAQAKKLGSAAMGAMGAKRVGVGQQVGAGKTGAKSKDEEKRAQVTALLQGVFDTMKTEVEDILSKLDTTVDRKFTEGEKKARDEFTAEHKRKMEEYKDERYSGALGWARWLDDKFTGLPAEADKIFEDARRHYVSNMRQVISDVADVIGQELTKAKQRIAKGRADIKAEVDKLPEDLKAIGKDAAAGFADQFDQLSQSVDDKGTELVDTLATKYTDAIKSVDEEIAAEKEKNKGLVAKAIDAVKAVINTILELKRLLLSILAKAAQAVLGILADPIGFLGNLVRAVGAGLKLFMANIGKHLQQGIMSWLLGRTAEAGLQLPAKFDTRGVLTMLASLLGLTPGAIWARISRRLPPQARKAAETVSPMVSQVRAKGVAAMWDDLKTRVGDLRKQLIDKVIEYAKPAIIIAGITWILSLLNPASAFVRAVKLIIDIVKFVVTQARQIFDFVNAVLDAVIAIAKGSGGGVPGLIERALVRAIPVLLGFLATLLGLGGLAARVKRIIQAMSKPVGRAIDWVIDKLVTLIKKLLPKSKTKPDKKKSTPDKKKRPAARRKPHHPKKPKRPVEPKDKKPRKPVDSRKPGKDKRDRPAKGAVAAALREAVTLVRPGATVDGLEKKLGPIRRRNKIKQLSLIIERFGPTKTTLRFAGLNSPEEKSGPVNLWHKTYDGIRHLVELTKGLNRLVTKRRTMNDGSTVVELLTFTSGQKVIRKVALDETADMPGASSSVRGYMRTGDERADAERLGFLVARAIGARVPAAFRYSETELLMDYIEGVPGRSLQGDRSEQERLMATEAGRRLGLLDVLIGNEDRNLGNWMLVDGEVVGIDQGEAWSESGKNLSGWVHKTFAKTYYDFENNRWRKNDIGRDEIENLERALEALRPEFIPSRQEWYDDMMKRFAEVKKHSRWRA